ncbi:hypothetical protein AB0E75_15095 [Streptomyces griseoviridis]|uniref:AB hydrolase-1 domain-containing protein n=1 Tax=Streptomyces griseoviridis TaxID=45398 RepID=A0A918GKZ3_STRGD|nr:hypothetical protein [Streptomyces niveoruber]GGS40347.1 hypothetical protein GCM10010238_32420 [Streptomyces niveoruber]
MHGRAGNASDWVTAMSVFRLNGRSGSHLFAYAYDSYGDNVTNAQGLASCVDTVKARTGASKVAIVHHSMGGLVSQYYLKVLGGHSSVSHLASVAGATHGTTYDGACLSCPPVSRCTRGRRSQRRSRRGTRRPAAPRTPPGTRRATASSSRTPAPG